MDLPLAREPNKKTDFLESKFRLKNRPAATGILSGGLQKLTLDRIFKLVDAVGYKERTLKAVLSHIRSATIRFNLHSSFSDTFN